MNRAVRKETLFKEKALWPSCPQRGQSFSPSRTVSCEGFSLPAGDDDERTRQTF